ncbi:uncharacterized protein [Solanum tuberosum]|uniref:uncharacterized protein n=1 Tax=Solanum tuberosum TaxID=4113 RepID=UPI00073A2BAD|nr:PREDICTED: uncharacterized protein LOC107063460 [Solanum tuberosum]
MPEPQNIHELKSPQGKLAYLRRFISNLAGRCQLFGHLMKKGAPFNWDETCSDAFKSIKSYLAKPPVLAAPIPRKPLILYITAQERSVGALLAQENSEGKENSLYYLSRKMTPNELNYSLIEKLCLALVFLIQKMKHYFQAHVVRLISRANPIKFVMSKPVLSDRLARWYLQFQQFEIVYIPQKSCERTSIGGFLADHPISDDWELTDELPDEDAMLIEVLPPWKIHFDGDAHRGGAGAGVVFITSQKEILPFSFTLKQCCSNNVAEYQALILGLEMAVDMKQLNLQVFGDSQLVINQLLGSSGVKKPELRPYHDYAQKLIGWLGDVTLQHVRRTENKKADALAALASTLTLPDQTQMTIFQRWIVPPPNEEEYIENELEHLIAVSEAIKEDWRQPIIDYMCYGILPEDPRRRTDIHRRAPRFLYYKDTLYRRSFEGVLLRFLPLERQLPSLRLAIQEGLTEEENARLRLAELEALDEKRLEAQLNLECYQARLSRAVNKKVLLRCFQVGDQVLAVRKPIITSHKSGGKFTSKWDGPYVVQEAYSQGAYKLVDADGVRIGPINEKFLKRYYR